MNEINTYGSWQDINYADPGSSQWDPHKHLSRLNNFALAYTLSGSAYYQNANLYNNIVNALNYCDIEDPQSNGWWWNQIAASRALGHTLIIPRAGVNSIPNILEDNLIAQMNR